MARPAEAFRPDWPALLEGALTLPGSTGTTYRRFYNYSTLNVALLQAQGCPPEPIATFQRWKGLDRHVKRGSKARAILRPIQVKREDEKGEEETFTKFKLVNCIFPYSDTEGEELPEYEPPTWSPARAMGELGITKVAFDMMNGNIQGLSVGNEFAVNPMARYPLKTTIHEMGHIVLGHTTPAALLDGGEHRGIHEFQAEGTAHIVMNELDEPDQWDAAESRAYIQGWLKGQRPSDVHIRGVFTASDRILKAGRVTNEGGEI